MGPLFQSMMPTDDVTHAAAPRKGQLTRDAILQQALHIAQIEGLESLSLGDLADQMRMSKTGVFARFGSKLALKRSVLALYAVQFEKNVFQPARQIQVGLPRLEALFQYWIFHITQRSNERCLFISSAFQYQNEADAIGTELLAYIATWRGKLRCCIKQAIEQGHLRDDSDIDQITVEVYGLILGLHHDFVFLKNRRSIKHAQCGFEKLITSVSHR